MSDLSVVPQRCVLVVARISPGLPEASADGWGTSTANATPDPIRTELGLPAATRVILFQSRIGLDEAAAAVLLVPDAALVLLGFGRSFERECARDREPRVAGRHFTRPARHPDELLGWTAAVDVALVPLPPVSVNQRLSSPNKFWEALVAGTRVVVPVALSYMAEIILERDLGIAAASAGAADLGLTISACLARPGTDPGWRARIRATAGRDYTWPVAATTYRKVIARLA
jgi:glycosyltransferase involved in cell wall biosynthesis